MLGMQHPVPHKAQLLTLSCMWQVAHHSNNGLGIPTCMKVPAQALQHCGLPSPRFRLSAGTMQLKQKVCMQKAESPMLLWLVGNTLGA